jgi:hypothetical protein
MATSSAAPTSPLKSEIKIISHSGLFYWWPVWAAGYVMAALTFFGDRVMTTVPEKGSERGVKASGKLVFAEPISNGHKESTLEQQDVVFAPKGKEIEPPRLFTARNRGYGVVFCIILLLVVVITNVPMRGLWSVMVIITIVLLTVIFALVGVWNTIMHAVTFLDIRITLGGYVLISTVLLVVWMIAFFLFDQQVYMIFTQGQFRVRLEIGEGETAYDTAGMTIHKQRSDLFRHWFLGLGSGDLIVRTAGAQAHTFDLPNVLFLGRKVKEIEDMLRTKQVTAAPVAG